MNDLILVSPEPKKYTTSEFKITTLREHTIDYGNATIDTPERLHEAWQRFVPTAPWFRADQECCVLFTLNTRKKLTGYTLISLGTLDTILVTPREIFRPAIISAAATIMLAHNHPSGDPTPSEGDIKVTRDLIKAGNLLKIELLDHMVIGQPSPNRTQPYVSLREMGYFYS
jgi:DNA repair protein RadC